MDAAWCSATKDWAGNVAMVVRYRSNMEFSCCGGGQIVDDLLGSFHAVMADAVLVSG